MHYNVNILIVYCQVHECRKFEPASGYKMYRKPVPRFVELHANRWQKTIYITSLPTVSQILPTVFIISCFYLWQSEHPSIRSSATIVNLHILIYRLLCHDSWINHVWGRGVTCGKIGYSGAAGVWKNIDPQLENYTHSYIHKPYGHILFSYWCPIHIYLTKIQNKHIFQICTLSC